MKTLKALVAAIALLAFGAASAQEAVVVHRPNPIGIAARDLISGAVLGAAVGGGIILYNMGIQNRSNYDWGRTLALSSGIGAAAGLVWGIVDATSVSGAYATQRSITTAHDGQSMSLDGRRQAAPGTLVAPIAMGSF